MMTFVLVAHIRSLTWNWSFSVDKKFFKVKITFNQLTKVSKFLDLQKKRSFHQLTKVLNSNLVSSLKVFKISNLLIYWKENFWSTDQNEKSFNLLKNITKNFWYSEKDHFGLSEIWSSSPFACKLNTFYLKNCCFTTSIKKQKKHFLENWFFLRKSIFLWIKG